MPKPIVNLSDLVMKHAAKGKRYGAQAGRIGGVIGMEQLGAQYMIVPPGRAAFPRHAHHRNEEMFVILEGTGTYRAGDQSWPVRPGDVIAAPAGFGGTAHQLTNTADAELRYLVVSTRHALDVTEYPDSGKFAVTSGIPAGQGMLAAAFAHVGRIGDTLDYWDGEDVGED